MTAPTDKARSLRAHKRAATGLFLLMVAVYITTVWMARSGDHGAWLGYVNAFAEAAMVGALADWFAVTALFHHPLGIPIPHTNLIEHSKARIGANLGDFVVSNFLTPASIRPYLEKLSVARLAGEWLGKEKNKTAVVAEATRLLADILQKMDDRAVTRFVARKGSELLGELKVAPIVANALEYFLRRGEHQAVVTLLAGKVAGYIGEHNDLVRQRVKQESFFFIPGFVNNKVAEKITAGLVAYFQEIEADESHRVRDEISEQLGLFVARLRTEPDWDARFASLREGLLSPDKLQEYAAAAWTSLKTTLLTELTAERSPLKKYLAKTLADTATRLSNDPAMQEKIDGWIRVTAYRYILRNRASVGGLISNTVGNWQGRELSQKLELEVGRDLQFIRINGTVVGGLVGLVIYAVTEWVG